MSPVDFTQQPITYVQITPANPAVNASYVYTVPDNTIVELIALYVDYVAAAGVHHANTQVRIAYNSARILCRVMNSWQPAGGTTTQLSFALSLAFDQLGLADLAARNNLPHRLYLYPTNQIILSMHNDILNDQFTNISLYLQTWIME